MNRVVLLSLCAAGLAVRLAWGQNTIPEPSGYRMQDYRAPTPTTLSGALIVTTLGAEDLWRAGAAFVDVLPHAPRPPNLPTGTLWHEKARMNIPGSIWLPDTGYGVLATSTERYLRNGLAHITHGDESRWLIIYCQKDCWMSWNAAKRALAIGFKNVAWYPDGTDGWEANGLPVQQAQPFPADTE
jgi:PQQ-dependent catabolism-associated CXXCW motif protein